MKLSQEEKDALTDHYKNRDLYDPSKAPEQQVVDFTPDAPAGMNCGGEMGYAGGGPVEDIDRGLGMGAPAPLDFNGPQLSADTQTARVPLSAPPEQPAPVPSLIGSIPQPPQAVARPALPRPSLLDAPEDGGPVFSAAPGAAEEASPVKSLKSDEYNELLRYLKPSRAQNIGRAAFSGLAGLADAIVTGVGRAPSSSFQKNMAEKDSSERKDLTEALRQKYEAGFKGRDLDQAGKRLAEEVRAHGADEKNAAGRLKEEGRAHDLEAGQRAATLGQEANKLQVEAAHKIIEAYEKGSGIGSLLGTSVRPSAAEYNAAKNVIQSTGALPGAAPATVRIRDSKGGMHDLPSSSLAAAKKRDPGLQVVP